MILISDSKLWSNDLSSLHVEEAEDKLVQNTETAIGLMKAVLENVRVRCLDLSFVPAYDVLLCSARASSEPL